VAEFSNKLDANWGAASAGGAEFGAEVGAGGVYRGGSYFYGDQLSMVDCMLLPHAFRYFAIEHYRGESFAIPRTAEFEPFHRWRDAMVETASVARTLPDKGRYIEHVRKYAEGTARSMVANAVRAGKAAHEMGEK
jgi:glutathione S-transferase